MSPSKRSSAHHPPSHLLTTAKAQHPPPPKRTCALECLPHGKQAADGLILREVYRKDGVGHAVAIHQQHHLLRRHRERRQHKAALHHVRVAAQSIQIQLKDEAGLAGIGHTTRHTRTRTQTQHIHTPKHHVEGTPKNLGIKVLRVNLDLLNAVIVALGRLAPGTTRSSVGTVRITAARNRGIVRADGFPIVSAAAVGSLAAAPWGASPRGGRSLVVALEGGLLKVGLQIFRQLIVTFFRNLPQSLHHV